MFDHDIWRHEIAQRLTGFARNPRQELQLTGTSSLLGYLVTRTLEPFLDVFQHEPVTAVLALAEITRGPGADQIVKRAMRMRYQSAAQVERELRTNRDMRQASEQLLLELHTLSIARGRLNSTRETWLRNSLERELETYPGEFIQMRRALADPAWQTRFDALRSLRNRQGRYTPADLVLIHDGLGDSAAHVRAAASRALGQIAVSPPPLLIKTLVRVALHDCDAETRFAAARSLGLIREHVASPQMLDYFSTRLFDEDGFVRSAAAVALGQLGEYAGVPILVRNLVQLLDDSDAYARESAARALGQIGAAAASSDVIAALTRAAERGDMNLHEAATDSLHRLREIRSSAPLSEAVSA